MPIFVEYGSADQGQPVENGRCETSFSLASGATSAVMAADGYVTITADENGYIEIQNIPDSTTDPRRRLLLGVPRSFAVEKGQKIMFTAG